MKRQFSEKAFREHLDQIYPRGIELDNGDYFQSAKEFQKKSNTTFRTMYNDWIEFHEREHGHNFTGCYD